MSDRGSVHQSKDPLDLLKSQEKSFLSKVPEITHQATQISFAGTPTFGDLDLLEQIYSLDAEQLNNIKALDHQIESTKSFIPFLYSYRSISGTINKSKVVKEIMSGQSSEHQASFQEEFISMFTPFLNRLLEILNFSKSAEKTIQNLISGSNFNLSDVVFEKLMVLLNIIFSIEQIKLLKSGINNDISYFKRIVKNVSKATQVPNQTDVQELQIYLSTPLIFFSKLQTYFTKSSKEHKNEAEKSFKNCNLFLSYLLKINQIPPMTPSKFSQILTSIYAILLMHHSSDSKTSILSSPLISDVAKILSENPIGILYGDNIYTIDQILKHVPWKPIKDFPILDNSDQLKNEKWRHKFLIKHNVNRIRKKSNDMLRLANSIARGATFNVENLYRILDFLSEMTLMVQLQSNYKFSVKAQTKQSSTDQKIFNYDLVVSNNYSSADLNALVEIIGYIKSIATSLFESEGQIQNAVFKHINETIQDLVLNTLELPIISAKHYNDNVTIKTIQTLRNIFGRWGKNDNPDLILKSSAEFKPHSIKDSPVYYSQHHIDVIRAIIQNLIHPNSPAMKKQGFGKKAEIKEGALNKIQLFLNDSCNWNIIINYSQAVKDASNLGSLWFREVYREIDDVVAFPVRSSLPFILAEHLLTVSNNPSLHDSFLNPFELYNDAAAFAIKTFDSQYLYREIVSEVNICIETIAFSFAYTLYRVCRETSAGIELPPDCLDMIRPLPMRYDLILVQNKLEILGSQLDFNLITSSKLNQEISKEITFITNLITDLRLVCYAEHFFRVLQTTHSLLTEKSLHLDSYEMIWCHAVGLDNPLLVETTLCSQIQKVLQFNQFKFNCMTRRFFSLKPSEIKPISKEKWASIYAQIHQRESIYVGQEHVNAIINMLTPPEIGIIIKFICDRSIDSLQSIIRSFTQVAPVIRLLPNESQDDTLRYFKFSSDAYSSITHPNLGKLYDSLRILGNIIAFVWFFDCEYFKIIDGRSIIGTLIEGIKKVINDNHQLFQSDNNLDLESTITHRAFASLWSVLEFLFVSSYPIKFRQNNVVPLPEFGDGVIIAAHVLINLCGQESLYLFDSTCHHAIKLNQAQKVSSSDDDLDSFLNNLTIIEQARNFAKMISYSHFPANEDNA